MLLLLLLLSTAHGQSSDSCALETAPLLERQHTAIFVGLPVALSCAVLVMIVFNVFLYISCRETVRSVSGFMAIVWTCSIVCVVWFCVAFQYGFTPRYLESLYVNANATMVDSSENVFRCVNVHSCACTRSFAESCSATRSRLLILNQDTTFTVECSGDSCCRRTRNVCVNFRQICNTLSGSCSTVCDRHQRQCVDTVVTSKCSATLGNCTNIRVTYMITTACNDSITHEEQMTCQPNDLDCRDRFRNQFVNPGSLQIYYAPWNTTKQIRRVRPFAGHVINMLLPLLILLFILISQIVIWIRFVTAASRIIKCNAIDRENMSRIVLSSESNDIRYTDSTL